MSGFPAPPTPRDAMEVRLDGPDDVAALRDALARSERRAVVAEAECTRLRNVCRDWGSNYDSWVDAYRRMWEQRNALHDAVTGALDDPLWQGRNGIRRALDSVPFDREADRP